MKYETAVILLAFFGLSSAAPTPQAELIPTYRLRGREVPQEHSHNKFLDVVRVSLTLNNPDKIQDPVFGLLGNAAAIKGAGNIADPDCLHQATADQAFTNAKAAGDIAGQVAALQYAALERNTGSVGLKSVACTAITAVNAEIAAISPHQDPAADGAAAINKAIVLELAKQIAAVGGDPQLALETGTFAPGTIGDPTGAGNTCDTVDDVKGCIFSLNLLVEDATAAEIDAAVAGVAAAAPAAAAACPAPAAAAAAPAAVDTAAAAAPATGASATTNVQTFTGTLGGAAPPIVSSAGDRPFSVNGNTFVNLAAAVQRSCDVQNNACFNAANSDQLSGGTAQCSAQQAACTAAAGAKKRAALDLGSCSDPTIKFAEGLEGRDQAAFIANNQADFNHGSALNIGVIASFICSQLGSSCKAGADAVAACAAGQSAAAAATGQAAADAFNAALAGAAPAPAAAAAPAAVAAPAAAAAAATPAAAVGANVQTFTGALGGAAPPVIQSSGDRPFSVNGATFVNIGAALQRSCAIQNNACSNAANSGQLAGGTAQCGDQEKACNAAA